MHIASIFSHTSQVSFGIMNCSILTLALVVILNCLAVHAKPATQVPCECHTWHNITVKKGTWDVEITPIFQGADFFMANCSRWVDSNNASVARFSIDADNNDGLAQFGYLPTNDDTFDCAYSLTLVRTSGIDDKNKRQEYPSGVKGSSRSLQFHHIACQFTITAAAAATPDVRAQEYNGALCRWDINPGVGENYYIDYVLV